MGPECTPDGTGQLVGAVFTRMASMEPEFALRMEPALSSSGGVFCLLQWSRSLHSGWNAAEAVGRVVRFPASMEPEFALRMEQKEMLPFETYLRASMEPEFALRMELFPQNSKGKQALQTAFSSTRTERANLPFHPARGKKKFLYSC